MGLIKMARRALSFQTIFETDRDGYTNTASGQFVDRDSALSLAAVWACVRMMSNTVATLPLDAYFKQNGQRRAFRPKPSWIETPVPRDMNMTRAAHMTQVMTSLMLDGNAFIMVAPDIANPNALYVLNPRMVTIKGELDDDPTYEVRLESGGMMVVPAHRMLHIPFITFPGERRGYDPIKAFRQSIGHGLAVEEFGGRFFSEGATMSGLIKTQKEPSDEQLKQLKDTFRRRNMGRQNSHAVGVITGGAEFQQLSIAPENAQFIETAKWSAEQVARLFGVPAHMIGLTENNASYASIEHKSIEFVQYSLRPYVERIEAAYKQLVPGDSTFVKFNLDGLLRGDIQSRYTSYSTGIQSGFLVYDDIRRWEDLDPLPGGDVQRVPLENAAAETADLSAKAKVMQALVYAGYEPEAAGKAVGLNIKHTGIPPNSLQPNNEDIQSSND